MEICRICNNKKNNKTYKVKEMMFGLNEMFNYFECGDCGSLQLIDVPESLDKYYPKHYWDFEKSRFEKQRQSFYDSWLRVRRTKYWLTKKTDVFGKLISYNKQQPIHLTWIKKACIEQLDAKILDVGCGLGDRLLTLQKEGFRNLVGVDPFIDRDIDYGNGVKIFNKSLFDMQGQFDFISLHHSFEHMPEPLLVLKKIFELIKPGHKILVRIPVASSYAWKHYGVNWFQIDAPRHLFLHTESSMNKLSKMAGFTISDIVYDSNAEQFWASEQYKNGIPLTNERSYDVNPVASIFSTEQIQKFREQSIRLNKEGEGDQACFYLKKNN